MQGNAWYLDRHYVACKEGEYIQRFKLEQRDSSSTSDIKYEFTCCSFTSTSLDLPTSREALLSAYDDAKSPKITMLARDTRISDVIMKRDSLPWSTLLTRND